MCFKMVQQMMHLALEPLFSAAFFIVISVKCANLHIGGSFLHASLSQLELLWHDEQGLVRIMESIIQDNPFKWPTLKE